MGAEELRLTKENLGWPPEPSFLIPDEALKHFRRVLEKGDQREREWMDRYKDYEKDYPELAQEWK